MRSDRWSGCGGELHSGARFCRFCGATVQFDAPSPAQQLRQDAAAQLTMREIRKVGALRAAFPELGDSAWGLTRIPVEDGDTLGIE